MSRLGKSFKNRFLRQALALVLAGSMVMSGMPASLAAESSDGKTSIAEVQEETENASEEAAEEQEAPQKESSEIKETESKKPTGESETASKKETNETDKETNTVPAASKESSDSDETVESEELETNSEEVSETEGSEFEDNKEVIYSSDSAALVDGHTYATWGLNETALNDDGSSATAFEGQNGVYKNAVGDMLYIDTTYSGEKGKFNSTTGQVRANKTKIYVPVKVENNQAKIILYQKSINTQQNVIYTDGMTENSLALSGADYDSAQCSAFVKSGDAYRTELTCTLTGDKKSSIICIEAKGTSDQYISKIISGEEVRDDVYDSDYGNSEALVKYNMEGFAKAYGVTGGGMLKNTSSNYYQVSNASEFLEALTQVKAAGEPAVIEVTGDLNLGSLEIGESNLEKYSKTKLFGCR